jgi:hypothetical protein
MGLLTSLLEVQVEQGRAEIFYGTALNHFLEVIFCGFYAVADSAYTLSYSLLVPFSGINKKS